MLDSHKKSQLRVTEQVIRVIRVIGVIRVIALTPEHRS